MNQQKFENGRETNPREDEGNQAISFYLGTTILLAPIEVGKAKNLIQIVVHQHTMLAPCHSGEKAQNPKGVGLLMICAKFL